MTVLPALHEPLPDRLPRDEETLLAWADLANAGRLRMYPLLVEATPGELSLDDSVVVVEVATADGWAPVARLPWWRWGQTGEESFDLLAELVARWRRGEPVDREESPWHES